MNYRGFWLVLMLVTSALVVIYEYKSLLDLQYGKLFSNLRISGLTPNFRRLSFLVDLTPLRENVVELKENVQEKITIAVENRVHIKEDNGEPNLESHHVAMIAVRKYMYNCRNGKEKSSPDSISFLPFTLGIIEPILGHRSKSVNTIYHNLD